MIAKFIDKNRKDDYDYEVIARCESGTGILSVKTFAVGIEVQNDPQEVPVIEVEYYSSVGFKRKKNFLKAKVVTIIEPWAIVNFVGLLNRKINDGVGAVIGMEDEVLALEIEENEKTKETELFLYAFASPKDMDKFLYGKRGSWKKVLWMFKLGEAELKKFTEEFNKQFKKAAPKFFEEAMTIEEEANMGEGTDGKQS